MNKKRASGVLLHITSLPGKYGIGDLGPDAYRFADFLVRARQSYWQILPLNPPADKTSGCPYRKYGTTGAVIVKGRHKPIKLVRQGGT